MFCFCVFFQSMPNNLKDQHPSQQQNKASSYLQLTSLIKSYISRVDRLKEEIKEQKDMMDNVLENDEVYQSHLEKAKEATRIKNETKKQLLTQSAMMEIAEKIKTAKEELKEAQETLSGYLKQFQELSDETQIEGEDGQVREIVSVLKLVKKSAKYNP